MTTLLGALLASSLSCTKVPIKNYRFCGDKGEDGAVCDYINGGPTERYSKLEWDDERFGMACTEVETVTDIMGVIRKLCFDSGRCSYEEYHELESKVRALYRSLDVEDQDFD